jgi:hypothetical protein
VSSRIVEQAITDMVEVTDLDHGVTLLTFAWSTRPAAGRTAPTAMLARTADVDAVLAPGATSTPVTDLADTVTSWHLLRRAEGVPDIIGDVPWEIARDMRWREQGGLPSLFVDPAEAAATGFDPADLIAIDYQSGAFTSFLTSAPLSRALLVDVSAEYYDLPALAAILDAHPWVAGLHYDSGLGGGPDHVPPRLHVRVLLPQAEYEQVLAADPTGPGYATELALFTAPRYGEDGRSAILGHDPLGVAAAIRTSPYPHPTEEEHYYDGGETFPALAEAYPTIGHTFSV